MHIRRRDGCDPNRLAPRQHWDQEMRILMNAIVPKIECAGDVVGREREVRKTVGNGTINNR